MNALAATLITSIPSPGSGAIEIGPLDLRAYGLMIALGVIAAVWLFGRRLEDRGWGNGDDASALALWGVAGGIIGARLYHVATDWHRFEDNLGDIPKIWEGGLGIPGGMALGILLGAYAGKRRGIPVPVQLTLAAPALPLAQAIGRWGNWFNQELYGRPTDLPWALEIDDAHNGDYPAGTTFHPAFLYESLWNFGVCAALLLIDRRWGHRLAPGKLLAFYLIGYGTGRLWIEGLRIDPSHDIGGLRWNQWVALALIVGGLLWLIAAPNRPWPVPPGRDELDDAAVDAADVDELARLDGIDDPVDAVDEPEWAELDDLHDDPDRRV